MLIEAECFRNHGGWYIDSTGIEITGSPYLLAHGLGCPVEDAVTDIILPECGIYYVWVRTRDWAYNRISGEAPGIFNILVNDICLPYILGNKGSEWNWQLAGSFNAENKNVKISLHDLTGFDGRCDALFFSKENKLPFNGNRPPKKFKSTSAPSYDIIVAGGGYAGICAAVMAARKGCSVALLDNRCILGGNACSDIRVPIRGLIEGTQHFIHLGDILCDFQYDDIPDAGNADHKSDEKIYLFIKNENVKLYQLHHVMDSICENNVIKKLLVLDILNGEYFYINGKIFIDCTGNGDIGFYAGADYEMENSFHMGMTNLWRWKSGTMKKSFSETPWALQIGPNDFPLHSENTITGAWCWESGYKFHPINDLEKVRDHNLRAIFGAWSAVKHEGGIKYENAFLDWVSPCGGLRESRRLMGDVVLNEKDMLENKMFEDAMIPVTWFLDRHIPDEHFQLSCPDNPFIAKSLHLPGTNRDDRPRHGKPWMGIPYRCLYSRNIENLLMAGRCISTSLWGLGAVRVIRTCAMMGEVVGAAAFICVKNSILPKEIYPGKFGELSMLFK